MSSALACMSWVAAPSSDPASSAAAASLAASQSWVDERGGVQGLPSLSVKEVECRLFPCVEVILAESWYAALAVVAR